MLTFDRHTSSCRLAAMSPRQVAAFGIACAQRVIVPHWVANVGPAAVFERAIVDRWGWVRSQNADLDRAHERSLAQLIETTCQSLESEWVASVANVCVAMLRSPWGDVDSVAEVAYQTYALADALAQEDLSTQLGAEQYIIGPAHAPIRGGLTYLSETQLLATPRVQRELARQAADLEELERSSPLVFDRLMDRRHQDRRDFYRDVDPELLTWE